MACPSTVASCQAYCDSPKAELVERLDGTWCICTGNIISSCCTFNGDLDVWTDTTLFYWTDKRRAYQYSGWLMTYIVITFLIVFTCVVIITLSFRKEGHGTAILEEF